MKRTEVPQDGNRTLGGERKAIYALDEKGVFERVKSTGWEVEECVTGLAIAEFDRLAKEARKRATGGLAAPLEYHMYARRMDVQALSEACGLARWRVRRHLKPAVFARLPARLRARYAQALGLPEEELSRLP